MGAADALLKKGQVTQVKQIYLPRDYTNPKLFVEHALERGKLRGRFESLHAAGKTLQEANGDDFYSKLMGEMEAVNQSQEKYLQTHPEATDTMSLSLADY